MSSVPDRPEKDWIDLWEKQEAVEQPAMTFEEWLQERGDAERFAAEREEHIEKHQIDSELERMIEHKRR